MKKVLLIISSLIIMIVLMCSLTGCTFQITTSDNSVSASVDEETTETVNNVFDWILDRLSRVFNGGSSNKVQESQPNNSSETVTNQDTQTI